MADELASVVNTRESFMQDFKIPVARLIYPSDGLSASQASEVRRLAQRLASQSGATTQARVDGFSER